MKRFLALIVIGFLAAMPGASAEDVPSAAEILDLKREMPEVITAFKKADSTFQALIDSAAGYAVLPKIAKGGFIVGGARGTGLVYTQGRLLGYCTMTQASVGVQIGGQSFSEVIFFETADALKEFQKSGFAMSAQVGAVAASEGVSKNAKYQHGVMVLTLARSGLMAEASVGGQKFNYVPITE